MVPVPSLPPLLLVTRESHTCSHSRGVEIGTIAQLEEYQGHIVEARGCGLEDLFLLFLKVQSVTMFMLCIFIIQSRVSL